jgi:hypothetical protein
MDAAPPMTETTANEDHKYICLPRPGSDAVLAWVSGASRAQRTHSAKMVSEFFL